MPAIDIAPGIVVVKCIGCSTQRSIRMDQLVLGTVTNPYLIPLPQCPFCQTSESLNRTRDTISASSRGDAFDYQRRVTNTVSEMLRKESRVHPAHRLRLDQEGPPPDLLPDR